LEASKPLPSRIFAKPYSIGEVISFILNSPFVIGLIGVMVILPKPNKPGA
jgi:hypothetical protein